LHVAVPISDEKRQIALPPGISRGYLLRHRACPRTRDPDGTLVISAVVTPLIDDALADFSLLFDCETRVEEVADSDLELLIERLTASSPDHVDFAREGYTDDAIISDVRDLASQPPVVRFVNLLVRDAFEAGASDIHLEATRTALVTRYRIDGVLTGGPQPSPDLRHAIVSRIKLLAELDIAERRRPQDGRVRVRLESRELDLRVSTIPTMHGESVVLRLLDSGGRPIELSELGLTERALAEVVRIVKRPHGMLLVTGPTGSGKTTTLYSALGQRSFREEKIITVEDPVEYQLEGVAQMPVSREVGVTFAAALRSILRQDPDVVMIGEMRDAETAEIAVQAAMTGHLVLSTLHTNDALSAIPRLVDLGVPEYLIAATLEGVLAQRLVRRICDHCRIEEDVDPSLLAELAGRPVGRSRGSRGLGCPSCRGTGYRGRMGIFEVMTMNDALRDAIARRVPRAALRELAEESGLEPLRLDGLRLVANGTTSLQEVLRVVRQ
jgi:general secretion pathway protein E